ncbi:GroES-like protein [Glarea lozoyensis ATCC 20868]|uniref:GroES-like protein n=1 Tax=Glarea lozoyensis (strain ATCC 20868 / MF5171) TaxID=1116229 RepID=S3DM28_GLAL2|nr:GroES-like protein [Glarea lozoyensis ATCC 20868]EPE27583.1 GroES-like protein [Glarea lozoyensis ATCC 20868]
MSEINVARLFEFGKPLKTGKAEKPVPASKDVLIKVEACCLVPNAHNLMTTGGGDNFQLPELPCVFGLDAAGVVESVGDHVFGIKPGDRVYVDPFLTCGTCHQCRRGRKDLCINCCLRGYFAQTPGGEQMLRHYPLGALSQYVVSPDANLAVLPPSIDFPTASRFGYIGTSFSGLKKGGAGPGKTVVINGVTGTLGYAAVAIALGLGCIKILGVGRNKERLAEVAKMSSNGRVATISTEDDKDVVQWIQEQTNGVGPDLFYDCLGNGGDANSTRKLIGALKSGGRAVLAAGGADGEISQKYSEAMSHDVAILGTNWFNSVEVDELIALVDAGVIDLSFLRHELFPLEKVNEAFEFVGDRPGGAINVVVEPQK